MAFEFLEKLGIGVASLAITVYVLSTIGDALPVNGTAANLVNDLVAAFTNVGTWLPIIVIVSLASLVFIIMRGMSTSSGAK